MSDVAVGPAGGGLETAGGLVEQDGEAFDGQEAIQPPPPPQEEVREEVRAEVRQDDKLRARVIKPILGKPRRSDGIEVDETGEKTEQSKSATPPSPTPAEKFVFGGVEFDNKNVAEQNFRTLRGMYKSLEDSAKTNESKASGWYTEAQRLAKRVSELEAHGATTKPTAPAGNGKTDESQSSINWDLYAEIRKAADEARKPHEADRWLAEEMERVMELRRQKDREELRSEFEKSLMPVREMQEYNEQVSKADEAINSLSALPGPDGKPLYPELQNPQEIEAIGQVWTSAGFPLDMILTQQGTALAVLLYRFVKGAFTAPGAGSPPAEVGFDTDGLDATRLSPQQLAASTMIPNGPARSAAKIDPNIPPEVRALFASMHQDMAERSNLGFSR